MDNQRDSYEFLKTLLVEQFDIPEKDISPDARLFDDLGIDSIDAVDMVVHLRNTTGERVSPQRFKSVRTVQDVVEIVDRMHA